MSEHEPFPLDQWFDISKPISKAQIEECLEQMSLYGVKQGDAPKGKEWKQARNDLLLTVRAHNKQFRA